MLLEFLWWVVKESESVMKMVRLALIKTRTDHKGATKHHICGHETINSQKVFPSLMSFNSSFLHVRSKSLTGSERGVKAVNYLLKSLHSSVSTNYSQ